MAEVDLAKFHGDLVDRFMSAEDASEPSRRKAERDIDYYDNRQWTEAEIKALKKRGQPAITQNLIKQKIDFLLGLERTQRTVPNGLPRTPKHEDEAHAATDAIRYVADTSRFDAIRSACWADLLKAGWCGVEARIAESADPGREGDVRIERCAWDRMFWDPYSAERDFSDAGYLGLVIWMDREEAIRRYGIDAQTVFDETISATGTGTYDDRPKNHSWVQQGKHNRIRVVQMYYIGNDGEWDFCEFTKGGILMSGPSPWQGEGGKREHPYAWQSAHVDRDNNRYGVIRELIDLQDEVNKRRSKALHLATARQTYGNEKAQAKMSARDLRDQMSRPDGHIPLGTEAVWGQDFGIIPTGDQAAAHFQLLQQAMNTFEVMGPNAAMQGKKDGNESGRAIMAQQQGGAIQMGTYSDTLREMDLEVYRKVWRRIRQFWTGETWIRVTDDEKNLKFVAINEPQMQPVIVPQIDPATGQIVQGPMVDPATGQPMQQPVIDPATGQPILNNAVAELDLDIEIDDAPNMGTLQQEEFANLVDLAKIGVVFPPKVYLAASNLRNKGDLIRMMEDAQQQPQPNLEQQAAARLELENGQAQVRKTVAEADNKQADTMQKLAQAHLAAAQATAPLPMDALRAAAG